MCGRGQAHPCTAPEFQFRVESERRVYVAEASPGSRLPSRVRDGVPGAVSGCARRGQAHFGFDIRRVGCNIRGMEIEIINTGSELMLGLVLNTHQQWLCRQLADAGYGVARQTAVPDTAPAIQAAVREALGRVEFVIVTGGLGPTSDDLTREHIASLLGRALRTDPEIAAFLENYFAARKRPMPKRVLLQAQVPEGATVLPNPNGTAPGLAIEARPNPFRPGGGAAWLVMLPGPPRELRPMFTDHVLPLLRREFPAAPYACLTLRTTGIGESMVEDKIDEPLQPLISAGLELGYCAHYGWVDVRLAARGAGGGKIVAEAEGIVREKVGEHIYGTQDDELNTVVVRLLTERNQTLALAESCTGGFVASRITDVPGSSQVFLGGIVTYSNQAKQDLLGVREETLLRHGAVSPQTAREMAEGARARLHADYAVATTGIAGPGGGTEQKPVGTLHIGVAGPQSTSCANIKLRNLDRLTFKQVACQQALELLRNALLRK
jgi:nicotinamide-nucleotide amidase